MIQDNYYTWRGGYVQIMESPKGVLRVEAHGRDYFLITIKTENINRTENINKTKTKTLLIRKGKSWAKTIRTVNRITRQMYKLLEEI